MGVCQEVGSAPPPSHMQMDLFCTRPWPLMILQLHHTTDSVHLLRPAPPPHPLPRMVTCELSRVCWLRRRQYNTQHMQFTRRKEKLVKSREPAPGAFRKKSVERQCRVTCCPPPPPRGSQRERLCCLPHSEPGNNTTRSTEHTCKSGEVLPGRALPQHKTSSEKGPERNETWAPRVLCRLPHI